ncbi:MAG TPA: hypothetical protein DCE42_23380 [Myxococcales bacterium]|nr:hypothetical protein [Deltaproteobacteria bacterium]HAA57729.1 hypothetical protein [Myxococcales bacterium]|tara:strand:+ start:7398 stop:9182 length:1785 start_codon:yes stop_codon:yes gene_type:complete
MSRASKIYDYAKYLWKFQEGICVVLLQDLGVAQDRIHWGKKLPGTHVMPDIMLGDTRTTPECVLFISHHNGDDAGRMKSWRDINEVFTLCHHTETIRLAHITFGSGIPAATTKAVYSLYDDVLDVPNRPNMKALMSCAQRWMPTLYQLDREDLPQQLRALLADCSVRELRAIRALRRWLRSFLRGSSDSLRPWRACLSPPSTRRLPERAVSGAFRKSIGILSLFPDEERQGLYALLEGKRVDVLPLARQFQLVTGTLRGLKLRSSALQQVWDALGREGIEALVSRAVEEIPALSTLRVQVTQLPLFADWLVWIAEHWEEICSPKRLDRWFEACFVSPLQPGAWDEKASEGVDWHWLFECLMYILKATKGSRHAMSYTRIARQCGAEGRIGRGARLRFSYYAQRKRDLPEDIRRSLTKFLAQELKQHCTSQQIREQVDKIVSFRVSGYIERMMNAQTFAPLYWLLEDTCERHGVCYVEQKDVAGFLSDTHPKRPCTTKLALLKKEGEGRVGVHSRTAHMGVVDKRKELCARGRTLRLREQDGHFVPQFEERLVLLLDGDWKRKDLELLHASGWSRIYRWDECERLIQEVWGDGSV